MIYMYMYECNWIGSIISPHDALTLNRERDIHLYITQMSPKTLICLPIHVIV